MRAIILVGYFLLFSAQCASKKSAINETLQDDSIAFVYKQYTRGFYREYHIKKNTITSYIDYKKTSSETQKTIPMDWATCLELLTALDLNAINALNAPSDLRRTDKVHHAEITITIHPNTFRSSNFDHGNPPKAIKPLVDHLVYMITKD
jgi:hypothetical protein